MAKKKKKTGAKSPSASRADRVDAAIEAVVTGEMVRAGDELEQLPPEALAAALTETG